MADRSRVFMYLVAAGIALAGILLALGPLLRRASAGFRRFDFVDLRRWFDLGRVRIEPILPVLIRVAVALLFFEAWGAWRNARITQAVFAQNPEGTTFGFELQPVAHFLRFLRTRIFEGWTYFIPESAAWLVGMILLLANARNRSRFPMTAKLAEARRAWTFLIAVGWAIFVFTVADFLRRPVLATGGNSAIDPRSIVWVLDELLLGSAFLLPPLLAAIDDPTNEYLVSTSHRARRVYGRLVVLQLATWLPGLLAWLLFLASYRATTINGTAASTARPDANRLLLFLQSHTGSWQRPLEFAIGIFCTTAALWVCSSASFARGLRDNLAWWKARAPFLLLLCGAAGLASALTTVPFLAIGPRQLVASAVVQVVLGEARFAISVAAFCLLLGNWFETRQDLQKESPG
jgi:hypothetical protein